MRSRARQCAGTMLLMAVPLFPATGTPSQPFTPVSAHTPFRTTPPAETRAIRALDAISSLLALRPDQRASLRVTTSLPTAPAAVTSTGSVVSEGVAQGVHFAATAVTVKEGQTLWQIAQIRGVPLEAIVKANGLPSASLIRVGQRLAIPEKTAAQPTESAASNSGRLVESASLSRANGAISARHVVDDGESLWSIAQRYHVSVPALASTNGLDVEAPIHPGLKLVIPKSGVLASPRQTAARNGAEESLAPSTTVTVAEGQTLWLIARTHGVSVEAIAAANGLPSPEFIRPGQRLTIPSTGAVRPDQTVSPAAPPAEVRRLADGFLWPARGVMTQGFGWRRSHHHNGIDIAATRGAPIFAVTPGRVVFAGWYAGYGLAVIIDHGEGLMTLYGHASAVQVHPGQEVQAGQVIARVGCTGICTGPHLHFEVRIDGRPANPLGFLP